MTTKPTKEKAATPSPKGKAKTKLQLNKDTVKDLSATDQDARAIKAGVAKCTRCTRGWSGC